MSVFLDSGIEVWSFVSYEAVKSSTRHVLELNLEKALKISRTIDVHQSIESKLSLVARWLVHMEIQTAWIWLTDRLPYLNSEAYQVINFDRIKAAEIPKLIKKLRKELEKCTQEQKDQIEHLISTMNGSHFSSFRANLSDNQSIYKTKKMQGFELLKGENDFIVSIIRNGPGSEKFKRVWSYRARLLIHTDIDIKNILDFEGVEAADQGMIPLEDALLKWFINNRMTIEALKIKASLRLRMNQPVSPISEGDKFSDWYDILIR